MGSSGGNMNKKQADAFLKKNPNANSWAPTSGPAEEIAKAKEELDGIVKTAESEQQRIRRQQQAILESERARRSSLSTATKRNTIVSGPKGIGSSISSGNGTNTSASQTIVGG